MTTAVCFDLDGTLLGLDRPFDDLLSETFEDHLGASTEELVDVYTEAFLDAFEALEAEPYHAGMRAAVAHADGRDPFPEAAVADADDGVDVTAMVAAHREREIRTTTVSGAARDCLDRLAVDESIRVGVVTDGVGDWQREKLAYHDLTELVDETVVSYDVGGHKVDGAPYDALRERLDADEYVMVGDDYESDVEAARAAGFVPIHYEDDGTDLFAILRAFL